jgi:hypothetical protein
VRNHTVRQAHSVWPNRPTWTLDTSKTSTESLRYVTCTSPVRYVYVAYTVTRYLEARQVNDVDRVVVALVAIEPLPVVLGLLPRLRERAWRVGG